MSAGRESSPIARRFAQLAVEQATHTAITFRADPVQESTPLVCDFAKLWRRVERVTAHLQASFGIQPGDRVAWLGLNHELQLVTLVACARLGAMFMPLNYRLAVPELQRVVDDAQPALLIHDPAHATQASALVREGLILAGQDALIATSSPRGLPLPEVSAHAPVLLVYTSGTTGQAKGAVHTQAAVLSNAKASDWAHGFGPEDIVLSVLPLFHVGGLCIQTLPALLAGAQVVLHPRFDAAAWLQELTTSRPTLSLLVPATLRAVFEHPDWMASDVSCLRGIMTGSSTLPLSYLEAFHRRGVPVGQVYGSTETGPVSVVLALDQAMAHAGATGWPHPEAEIKLVDEQGQVIPPDQLERTGEVCVRATNLMRGYWSQQGELGLGLTNAWFHTGDLGQRAASGCLTIVGRSKDMIISGGENIYPAEIENLLIDWPGVAECTVVGLPDERWGEVPVAVIVRDAHAAGAALSEPGILQHLQGRIARFKLPRRVVFVQALPKSALGKVQKPRVVDMISATAHPI